MSNLSAFSKSCDVLVIGDEVESVLTAVSAARAGASVILARRSEGRLGGLSVRGGLSYMDITPEFVTGLFKEFLARSELVRVALNPEKAHHTLSGMLSEAGITVISGAEPSVEFGANGEPERASLVQSNTTIVIFSKVVIDATPDADIARAAGVPFIKGLGGILGEEQDFLGVSPVFRITGISVPEFRDFEERLRQNPLLPDILKKALPYHPPELRDEYITRPTFAPDDKDYLDVLNPVIGIDYHIWRHGAPDGYADAGIFIDGGNISRLADGSLGFNGLVAQAKALNLGFDDLLRLSQGGTTPEPLQAEMRAFERYLQEIGGFSAAKVVAPEELYVRQTVTLLSRENMTARKAIEGGVSPEKALGTFSYWLDLRGTQLWKLYPGEHLPKPVFNVGLDVALPLTPALQNFAFVSRSAGYSPIGQGTGRIVQHNALLGEGVGIAAALAALSNLTFADIADTNMPQIQGILKERNGGSLQIQGVPTWPSEQLETSKLLKADERIIAALRAAQTPVLF
jgi:hypothetical protein